jgi:hypothetical protein
LIERIKKLELSDWFRKRSFSIHPFGILVCRVRSFFKLLLNGVEIEINSGLRNSSDKGWLASFFPPFLP